MPCGFENAEVGLRLDMYAIKLGPVLVRESPAPILRPHPPKDADEVGAVISQSIVAFSRRKLVTDFQFFFGVAE